MASKRRLMVPDDSSAARMPRPGATIALATSLSAARFIASSQLLGRGERPLWKRVLAGPGAGRLLRRGAARGKPGVKFPTGVFLCHHRGRHWLDRGRSAGGAEFLVALAAEFHHRVHGGLEV